MKLADAHANYVTARVKYTGETFANRIALDTALDVLLGSVAEHLAAEVAAATKAQEAAAAAQAKVGT